MIFLDGLPTVNRSCVRHKNRVLCEERGHGGGIAVVKGLVILLTLRIKLLDYLWIDRVFLLGEGWHSKPIASPTRAPSKRIFIVSSRALGWFVAFRPAVGFLESPVTV